MMYWVVFLLFSSSASAIEKIHGLNFSAFKAGQSPGNPPCLSEAQIRERIAIIAPYTNWIRTFGTGQCLDQAGRIAREFGLKVAMQAWLSRDVASNQEQMARLIVEAQAGHVDLAIVGSEVLYRRDLTESQLLSYITQFRAAVPNVRVATSDTYTELLAHPAVIAAGDVVLPTIYAFWEGHSIDIAMGQTHLAWQRIRAAAGPREVIVAEAGWPSGGNPTGNAVPSPANQSRFFKSLVSWSKANSIPVFVFSAFDEAWKAGTGEGAVGATWGIWNEAGQMKPGMQPVFDGQTSPDDWSGNSLPGGPGTPVIQITYLPAYSVFLSPEDTLRGKLLHAAPAQHRIATYIQVNGLFWIKPRADQPAAEIQPDGSFSVDIVTGGNDHQATRIVLFAIPAGFTPPIVLGSAELPAQLYQQSIAVREVSRSVNSIRGRITDFDGFPVAAVNVVLTGTGLSTQTTPDGYYSFASLPGAGAYTLAASRSGWAISPPTLPVSGQGAAIADLRASSCTGYTLSPQHITAEPSGGSFTVSVSSTCQWEAIVSPSSAEVVRLIAPSARTGSGTLQFNVLPNLAAVPRMASISINGNLIQIAQKGAGVPQLFQDVTPSNVFFDYTYLMSANNIYTGCGGGNYCVNEITTRAAMAESSIRAFYGDQFDYPATPYFADVPVNHPQFRYIQKLKQLGVTDGCTVTTFCPGDPVTRGQMAVFIIRLKLGLNSPLQFSYHLTPYFTDIQPGHLFFAYIQKMRDLGITLGCTTTTYCGDAFNTLGQISVFAIRGFRTP
jgi:exo-beta-1,3-glucanase (GH17 family)